MDGVSGRPTFAAWNADKTIDTLSVWNAALSAVTDNAVIIVPPTNVGYRVSGTISIVGKKNLTILGYGRGSRIYTTSATFNVISIDSTSSDVTIDGIEINGSSIGAEVTAVEAISTQAPRTTIRNSSISNTNHGITIRNESANECNISNNRISDISDGGNRHGWGVYTISQRNIISGNQFDNVQRHDVYLSGSYPTGASYNVVSGNTSIRNGMEAFTAFAYHNGFADGNIIIGNTIKDCSIAIGLDQNTHRNIVSNNYIDSCNNVPIFLNGSTTAGSFPTRNMITNNTIHNDTKGWGAIRLMNSSYNVISGNIISGDNSVALGIVVNEDGVPATRPSGNIIYGNIFDNNVTTQISVGYVGDTPIGLVVRNNERYPRIVTDNTATTIDVTGRDYIRFAQTGPMTVTNFTGGYEGQIIYCMFGADNVTITQANAALAGWVNFVSTNNDTITLMYKSGNWFELSRSVN